MSYSHSTLSSAEATAGCVDRVCIQPERAFAAPARNGNGISPAAIENARDARPDEEPHVASLSAAAAREMCAPRLERAHAAYGVGDEAEVCPPHHLEPDSHLTLHL